MKHEIGSDFPLDCSSKNVAGKTCFADSVLTYSGRTSIQLAIDDILLSKQITCAWLPSYCCASMCEPFSRRGIPVAFYDVRISGNADGIKRGDFSPAQSDVVVTMQYFGFSDSENEKVIAACVGRGVPVIEDCTHSLLSPDSAANADYHVASIRKWFPTASGGLIDKKDGHLNLPLTSPNEQIIRSKIDAMAQKAEYLDGNEIQTSRKKAYLQKYKAFGQSLAKDYENLRIDRWSESILKSQDLVQIRQARRNNAAALLDGIQSMPEVKALFSAMNSDDCPLFFPILCSKRDALQKYLADREIYCPAHWPHPGADARSGLYKNELSLICDQRYSEKDMSRILDNLMCFYKEN